MPTWPATLPQLPVLRSTRVASPNGAIVRKQMDQGPPKGYTVSDAAPKPLRVNIAPLTEAQVAILEAFHETELGFGVLPFDFPHPIHDTTVSVQFSGESGHIQFTERAKDHYVAALNLEIAP